MATAANSTTVSATAPSSLPAPEQKKIPSLLSHQPHKPVSRSLSRSRSRSRSRSPRRGRGSKGGADALRRRIARSPRERSTSPVSPKSESKTNGSAGGKRARQSFGSVTIGSQTSSGGAISNVVNSQNRKPRLDLVSFDAMVFTPPICASASVVKMWTNIRDSEVRHHEMVSGLIATGPENWKAVDLVEPAIGVAGTVMTIMGSGNYDAHGSILMRTYEGMAERKEIRKLNELACRCLNNWLGISEGVRCMLITHAPFDP